MNEIAAHCTVCGAGIPKPKRGPVGKTCSPKCRMKLSRTGAHTGVTGFTQAERQETCNNPPEPAYSAAAIRILSDSECRSNPALDWEWAQHLAQEHIKCFEWIERGIRACREVGVEPEYFIEKYLHQKPIPKNTEVDQAFAEILKDQAA